jgi:3-phosphoshikimate 1-carboxyvinyltransferase
VQAYPGEPAQEDVTRKVPLQERPRNETTSLACSSTDEERPLSLKPVRGLCGSTTVPGDKSISHRALILGSLSSGVMKIRNLSPGEDVRSTWQCLGQLGVGIEPLDEEVRLEGKTHGPLKEPETFLDVGNSGTTIRLLAGLLSAQPMFSALTGDDSLRRRPMDRIVKPLRQMGAEIWGRENGRFAPLAIKGGRLSPIHYDSPIASAQVKTALLLAGLFLEGETSFAEPYLSRDHTERMLRYMGADVTCDQRTVRLRGGRPIEARDIEVPGDPSSAAFLVVGALITSRSELEIRDVCVNPTRIGYLTILDRMGASVELCNRREVCGEPVADLKVRSSRLKGTTLLPEEVPGCIDEIPVLCVAAAFAQGRTKITGAKELRVKESDRIAAMASNLSAMGVDVVERPDGLEIGGRGGVAAFQGRSWQDHRIALSLIVAALAAEGPSRVLGGDCMNISFPGFLERIAPLIEK